MKFQRLRGTHDIFSEDARAFCRVEASARRAFQIFGFEEIRTPILEEKGLFTHALGTETDVVQKEMYEFEDRSKTHVAMRPEGTAGVVRAYLENELDKKQGLAKFFYIGPMFRSERPQAGRLRQFHQIGVEVLGTASPYADAEAIQLLCYFLESAGAGGFSLKLNNLGTFEERGVYKEVLKKYFEPKKSKLCEDCQRRLEKNVFRVLDCKVESCREIIKQSPPITGHLGEESRSHHERVKEALVLAGIKFTEDVYMVRGLDYYTKTVFELTHSKLGAQDALAAGGRYDRLVESLGGTPAGAVGFAIGVERLIMCLSDRDKAEERKETFFVVTLGDGAFKKGLSVLAEIRKAGFAAGMDFEPKSMKSQMRQADKENARYVIILGDNEIEKKVFMLKDMKEGTQKELSLSSVVESLKKEKILAC